VNANSTDGSTIEVTVPLCTNGASIALPSTGYTFSAQVKFQGSYAFGDDLSGGGSASILIEGENYYNVVYSGDPIAVGAWIPLSGSIGSPSPANASHLTLRFFPNSQWSGIIDVDNVAIN